MPLGRTAPRREATLGQREREIERLRVEADACEVELEEERENQSLVAAVAQQRSEEAASEIARLKQQIAELTRAAGRPPPDLAYPDPGAWRSQAAAGTPIYIYIYYYY